MPLVERNGKLIYQLEGSIAETAPEAPAQAESGDFVRNLKKTIPQTAQLMGGTLAFLGETVGSDSLKEYGLDVYKRNESVVGGLTKDSDDFNNVLNGSASALDFIQGALGYVTGQALEAGASALAGSIIGSALAGPAGTVGGAAAGAAGKQVAKGLIKEFVDTQVAKRAAKLAAADPVRKVGAEVYQQAAKKQLASELGQAAGLMTFNLTQELGSIYPEALEEAKRQGKELDGNDMMRIATSAAGAAALESWMDKIGIRKVKEGVKGAAKALPRLAKEVPLQAGREAVTETLQTGVERFGAAKPVTGEEATREYINAAAIGAVGGGAIGGAAGSRQQAKPLPDLKEITAGMPPELQLKTGVGSKHWNQVLDKLIDQGEAAVQNRRENLFRFTANLEQVAGHRAQREIDKAKSAEFEATSPTEFIPGSFIPGFEPTGVDPALAASPTLAPPAPGIPGLLEEATATVEAGKFAEAGVGLPAAPKPMEALPAPPAPAAGQGVLIPQAQVEGEQVRREGLGMPAIAPPVAKPKPLPEPATKAIEPQPGPALPAAEPAVVQGRAMRKLEADAKTEPTVEAIHQLAASKNIPSDNAPDFIRFSKELTGVEHLDEMDAAQRQTVYNALSSAKPLPVAPPAKASEKPVATPLPEKAAAPAVEAARPLPAPRTAQGQIIEAPPAKDDEPGVATPEQGNLAFQRFQNDRQLDSKFATENYAKFITSGWVNRPNVKVINSMDEAPEMVRREYQKQQAEGAEGAPRAFIFQNEAYVVADQLDADPKEAVKQIASALHHEGVGHYGNYKMYGKRLIPIYDQAAKQYGGRIMAKAREYGFAPTIKQSDDGRWIVSRGDQQLASVATEKEANLRAEQLFLHSKHFIADRWRAFDETVAGLAQENPNLPIVKQMIAMVREFVRPIMQSLGADWHLSDDEIIRDFILPSRKYVMEGVRTRDTEARVEKKYGIEMPAKPAGATAFARADKTLGEARDERDLKKFHKTFMGEVSARAAELEAEAAAGGHKYEVGQRVMGQKSPLEIIGKMMLEDSRDIPSDVPWSERRRIMRSRPKVPGYMVRRHDEDGVTTFSMAERGIKGVLTGPQAVPDETAPAFQRVTKTGQIQEAPAELLDEISAITGNKNITTEELPKGKYGRGRMVAVNAALPEGVKPGTKAAAKFNEQMLALSEKYSDKFVQYDILPVGADELELPAAASFQRAPAQMEKQEPADTFYSQMERVLGKNLPNKAPAAEMAKQVQGLSKQFKQEELDWSGLPEWLAQQTGVVTKQQVVDYIRENNVQLEFREKGGMVGMPEGLGRELADVERARAETTLAKDAAWEKLNSVVLGERRVRGPNAGFEDWATKATNGRFDQLPQAARSALRNVYDTLPAMEREGYEHPDLHGMYMDWKLSREDGDSLEAFGAAFNEAAEEYRVAVNKDFAVSRRFQNLREQAPESEMTEYGHGDLQLPGAKTGSYRELLVKMPYNRSGEKQGGLQNFRAPHFSGEDATNLLAHVRFNERTDAEGKRVLFIEEVQSDWHQKGRKQGYGDKGITGEPVQRGENDWIIQWSDGTFSGGYYTKGEAAGALRDRLPVKNKGIPDAPFKQSWPMLVMKRMLRYAVDNGFDRIAWTTGEQQNARYGLSQHLDRIHVTDRPGGRAKRVVMMTTDGNPIDIIVGNDGQVLEGSDEWHGQLLADVIGKEMTGKILSVNGHETFEGDELEVGGEGMRGFYDKILPAEMNRYTKKFGGRVGTTQITTGTAERTSVGGRETSRTPQVETVHSVDITDAMRGEIPFGQPMFQRAKKKPGLTKIPGVISKEVTDHDLPEGYTVEEQRYDHPALESFGPRKNEKTFGQSWFKAYDPQGNEIAEGDTAQGVIAKARVIATKQAVKSEMEGGKFGSSGLTEQESKKLAKKFLKYDDDKEFNKDWSSYGAKEKDWLVQKAIEALGDREKGVRRNVQDQLEKGLRRLFELAQEMDETLLDQDGFPLRGFHATATDFDRFDPLKTKLGAIWVSFHERYPSKEQYEFGDDIENVGFPNWFAQYTWNNFLNGTDKSPPYWLERYTPEEVQVIKKNALAKVDAWAKANRPKPPEVMDSEAINELNDFRAQVDSMKSSVRDGRAKSVPQLLEAIHEFGESSTGFTMPAGPIVKPVYAFGKKVFDYERKRDTDALRKWIGQEVKAGRVSEEDARDEYEAVVLSGIGPEGDMNIAAGNWAVIQRPLVQRGLKELGFDGWWELENGVKNLAVYATPERNPVKDVFQKDGTYNLGDIRTSFQRSDGNRQSVKALEDSQYDSVIHALQDKLIDLKRIVEQIKAVGGKILDATDAYAKEQLFHSRATTAKKEFYDKKVIPLLNEMRLRKVEQPDLETYMVARQAESTNKLIAKRNPGNPDLSDGGSGMMTKDAQEFLRSLTPAQKRNFEALAKMVDEITEGTRKVLVDGGIESQQTIDQWKRDFPNYIPLHREDEGGNVGIGQGFSVFGRFTKPRLGSKRAVVDVIANIVQQRDRAIVKSEKNIVSNALYQLVKDNPIPDFWTVEKVPMERRIGADGTVMEVEDPKYRTADHVVMTKLRGPDGSIRDVAIVMNPRNERAKRLAMSFKNMDAEQMPEALGAIAKGTRWMAAMNTQYNPVFGFINLFRDVQSGMVNLSSTPLRGKQADVGKLVLPAFRGIYAALRAQRAGKQTETQWAGIAKEFEDFLKAGGATGFSDLFKNAEERGKQLQKELNKMGRKERNELSGARVLDLTKDVVGGWLSDYNTAMENAMRLAVYKVALENGFSKDKAAVMAKNITVNFNKKGALGNQMGAVYAFFNASTQGTARLIDTLFMPGEKNFKLSPAGKKIVLGGLAIGAAQQAALMAAGFDDDEPPEFVRQRSLIIPTGGKTYISLPMPLGLHVIPNLTRIGTMLTANGFRDPQKQVANLIDVLAGSFVPVGYAGLSLQTLTPTVLDPVVALAENKDWTGKPIAKPDFSPLVPEPGFTRAKDTSTWLSRVIAEGMNTLSGGSEDVAGLLSPTPDQIDYLAGQLGGGVVRELSKALQTVEATATGEELPLHKVPLVGRLAGSSEGQSAQASRYYEHLKKLNAHELTLKGKRSRKEPVGEYLAENPDARLVPLANATERRISQLRKRKRELLEQKADPARIRTVENLLTESYRLFNQRVEAARGR